MKDIYMPYIRKFNRFILIGLALLRLSVSLMNTALTENSPHKTNATEKY
jgi:hypothetical protein